MATWLAEEMAEGVDFDRQAYWSVYMCFDAFQMTHIREKAFLNQLEFALIWSGLV